MLADNKNENHLTDVNIEKKNYLFSHLPVSSEKEFYFPRIKSTLPRENMIQVKHLNA